MPCSQICFGTITADPAFSYSDFLPAYEWLEEEIGFFPHFLSAGTSVSAILRTGYADNWRVFKKGEFTAKGYHKIYCRKGEFPNLVLFSFDHVDGIFMDYSSWHIAINASIQGKSVSKKVMKMILKPSWRKRRWIRAAEGGSHCVDLLAPVLSLDKASRISVRNQSTKKELEKRGFPYIQTLRIPVEK